MEKLPQYTIEDFQKAFENEKIKSVTYQNGCYIVILDK